jgi:DnaJ like chaperone protein
MSKKTIFARWSGKLFFGGFLAFALSILMAEWLSGELHDFYRESMLWRDLFGADPNTITTILKKVSWALVFVCSWWMLWKLDTLLGHEPAAEKPSIEQEINEAKATEDDASGAEEEKKIKVGKKEKEPAETIKDKENSRKENKATFASVQPEPPVDPMEAGFAKTLGLQKPYSEEETKAAYRKRIAQYHPDRVSALGPEIREVAETKAKEINEAYKYFRKKFERDQETDPK